MEVILRQVVLVIEEARLQVETRHLETLDSPAQALLVSRASVGIRAPEHQAHLAQPTAASTRTQTMVNTLATRMDRTVVNTTTSTQVKGRDSTQVHDH